MTAETESSRSIKPGFRDSARDSGKKLPPFSLGPIRNLRLHELSQEGERLLPAHVAGGCGDHGRDAFLGDIQFGAAEDFLQLHRDVHFSG